MNSSLLGSGIIVIFISLFILAIVCIVGFIWWRIVSKTGYHGALGLLMLIPIANLIMILVLAFSEWPVEKELKQLKAQTGRI